ncbi:protein kinase [Candidatus Uabimicrobium sp. HlEnr_7]|uniref:protein kinase domain-containing protein n=1 Tax=Candidatus Uabimicrobium helgolandensis TaxID=3095367 RepID=UPI003556B8DD
MKINTQDIPNNIKLITLEGHIDENTISLVQDTFNSVFNLNQSKIICNMQGVEHISAPVLKNFLENVHSARNRGGDLKLLNVQASLQGIFRYAGFNDDKVFCNNVQVAAQQLEQLSDQRFANNEEDPFGATIQTSNTDFTQPSNNIYAPTIHGNQSPLQNKNTEDLYGATIQMTGSPLQNRNKPSDNQNTEDPYGATIQMTGSPLQNRNKQKSNQSAEDPYGATIQMTGSPLQNRKQEEQPSEMYGATISLDESPIQGLSSPQPKIEHSVEDLTNASFTIDSGEEQDLSFLSGDEPAAPPQVPAMSTPAPIAIEPTVTADSHFTQTGTQQDTKVFKYEITYKIADKIAEGHMGKLYRGEEISACGFHKPVALKYLKTHFSKQSYLEILTNEIRKASLITHQNIAQVHKLVALNNYYFVVMEHVDGVNLATMLDKLRQNTRLLPPHLASLIVYNICRALAYANRKLDSNGGEIEIIHGEITPENVIISKDLDIKLVGLGVSKASNLVRHQENPAFSHGFTHMAPEVKQSGIPSKSGDIFSLGVLFYELLTNQKPYTAEQINNQSNEIVFPSRINSKATDIVDGLVLRCLGANPASRWKDFEDLGLQLEESLQDKGFSLTQASLKKFLEINSIF